MKLSISYCTIVVVCLVDALGLVQPVAAEGTGAGEAPESPGGLAEEDGSSNEHLRGRSMAASSHSFQNQANRTQMRSATEFVDSFRQLPDGRWTNGGPNRKPTFKYAGKSAQSTLVEPLPYFTANMTWQEMVKAHPTCFRPNTQTAEGLYQSSKNKGYTAPQAPILNMGFPKTGTTSLFHFLECDNHYKNPRHQMCRRGKNGRRHALFSGIVMHAAMAEYEQKLLDATMAGDTSAVPPLPKLLDSCTPDGGAFTQLDLTCDYHHYMSDFCQFPQMELLQVLHEEAPEATFILPFRDIDQWFQSMKRWDGLSSRIDTLCPYTGLLASGNPIGFDEEARMAYLLCSQVEHVRAFVKENPSHKLIEYSIDDSSTSDMLPAIFRADPKCWNHSNKNPPQ